MAWARANSRILIIAAVILVAAVALVIYYLNAQQAIERRAAMEFGQVQQTLAGGNPQLAIRDLTEFVGRFGGSTSARQARLVLADLLLREDRPQEAIDALDDLPDDLDDPLGLAAARLQAAAHESLGNADEAVQTYRRIAGAARFDFLRQEALADAARVRLQDGDPRAATALYEEILQTFEENAPGRGYYEMWHAEARAQASVSSDTATSN